jgi:hypothetical protein
MRPRPSVLQRCRRSSTTTAFPRRVRTPNGPQVLGANAASLLFQTVNWKPVAAAVHGYVLGLGLGMALDCDLIVAEAWTPFQLTETSRGIGAAKHWAPRSTGRPGGAGGREALSAAKHWGCEALGLRSIGRNSISAVPARSAMKYP